MCLDQFQSEKYSQTVHLKKKTKGLCILKDFFYLVLEEKELKIVCVLKRTLFLLQLFLIFYTPKQIYAFGEKKRVKKKKRSFLPT